MKNTTKTKKFLSFVLTLCITLSLFATTQVLANYKKYDTSEYNKNDIEAVNALIKSQKYINGQQLTNNPDNWDSFVTWDESTPKRLTGLVLDGSVSRAADFSKFTELTSLSCRDAGNLTSVSVKGLTKLKSLNCNDCSITSLDITGCIALTTLKCAGNQLKSLDVSKSTLIDYLACESNLITSLDVSNLTLLRKLTCYENKLTYLKVSGATSLTDLDCGDNNLTALDISNTNLGIIDCNYNKMLSLDAITGTQAELLESGATTIVFEPQNIVLTATPTASKVLVNGKSIAFEAYTINGNNYFKLRDLAKVLSGTTKQFEVSWNNTEKAINLLSGKCYTPVGGELASGDDKVKTAIYSTADLFIDDEYAPLTAFTIGKSNYFKLRDIMDEFNAGVGWDSATSTITIDTNMDYTAQ